MVNLLKRNKKLLTDTSNHRGTPVKSKLISGGEHKMIKKLTWPILFSVCLSACDDTETVIIEAEARKQLYTLKIDGGESRLCGVDTHPIDPLPVLLEPVEVQIGYKSYDNGGRAFCEIERGYEYHAEVFFDLTPLARAGVTEINTVTLTGNLRNDPENSCSNPDVFAVIPLRSIAPFENDEGRDGYVYPQLARGTSLDGEPRSYRESLNTGLFVEDITVSVNRITASIDAASLTELERSGANPYSESGIWKGFVIVGMENPNWRGTETCLSRLPDLQLIVSYPESS